jgi:hypothetical protein
VSWPREGDGHEPPELTCADELDEPTDDELPDEELGVVVVVVVLLVVPLAVLLALPLAAVEVEVTAGVEVVVVLALDPVVDEEPMTPTRPTTPTVAMSPVPSVARPSRRNAWSRARVACVVLSALLFVTVAPRSSTAPWCFERLRPLQERHKDR